MCCFVTPHAMDRFRTFVANIPDEIIIHWCKSQINNHRNIIGIQMFDRQAQPIYLLDYEGTALYVPLRKQRGQFWPIIPTILRDHPRGLRPWKGRRWRWKEPS
ncbi:MAG: hypothetical protein H6727_16175 [Myxococcales bacterium]|nr:hypothetical protein [Myxococcales bacterium]